jgi:hypothetical protein
MKAEKRHQLQTNVLADSVGRLLQGMKSAPRTRSTIIWVFVVLAIGTIILWQYGAHASLAHYSALWTEEDSALRNPNSGLSSLIRIGDENRGTMPGRSARFQVARTYLQDGQNGIRSVLTRNDAAKYLYQARRLHKKLVKDCLDAPLLAQEAMMGVAQAEESLGSIPITAVTDHPDADDPEVFSLQAALASYQELAKMFPNSPLGKEADSRAKEIEKDKAGIEKFYADLNYWASRPKDSLPDAKMDLPPLMQPPDLPPVPLPGSPTAGPDVPGPKTAPSPAAKSPASGLVPPAPKPDMSVPTPKTDTKTPPAKADSKDSKSK